MKQIKTVELFAGVGGFRLGLEAASKRYKVIWANQWEPSMREQYAFDCYTAHFGKSEKHVCRDITEAKSEIPPHQLLVGGFPCQDYSVMNKNSIGIEGEKGALWWQIDYILGSSHPEYVILENVDHILRSPAKQPGRDFSIILRCFYEKGYAVEWRVVNAAEYGHAQRRRRIFIVAYYRETEIYKSLSESVCKSGLKSMHSFIANGGVLADAFPVSGHANNFTDDWLDMIRFPDIPSVSREQRVKLYNSGVMVNGRVYSIDLTPQVVAPTPLRRILETRKVEDKYFIRSEDIPLWEYAKGAKKELRKRTDGSSYYFSEGAVRFPDSLDMPSRTILTSESKTSRASHVVEDLRTGQLRLLTPVECERLNTFPDGWTNTGMPERMRYFCMGNALVVPLVKRIGKSLIKICNI